MLSSGPVIWFGAKIYVGNYMHLFPLCLFLSSSFFRIRIEFVVMLREHYLELNTELCYIVRIKLELVVGCNEL